MSAEQSAVPGRLTTSLDNGNPYWLSMSDLGSDKMKETVKKLLANIGYYRVFQRLRPRAASLVLMYHDFARDYESGSIGTFLRERTSRAHFEAHLSVLKRNCRVISIEQAVNEIVKDGKLREDTVSITFDDGYGSVYDIAYPLLRKYDLPATVYLTTNWINGKMTLWWEELADMIENCDISSILLEDIERILSISLDSSVADEPHSPKKKLLLHDLIASHMRELDDVELKSKLAELHRIFGYDRSRHAPTKPLDWAQITEMAENKIRFGSHTCSHLNLSHAAIDVVEKEILESRNEIESHIRSKVEGFAYPYGQDIESYRKFKPVLSRHGFTYACTAVPGSNGANSNLYALLRETLPPTESRALIERELLLDLAAKRSL